MRIGIDVTGLYITKAGIYYYSLNLLRHLLALNSEHEFVLLDYAPVRGDRTLPFDLRSLESERVRVIEIRGPRQRKLIDWKRLRKRDYLKSPAREHPRSYPDGRRYQPEQ